MTDTTTGARTAPPADPRAEYVAGLRTLADLLEQQPDLQLPATGRTTAVYVIADGDQKAQLADWARAMTGRKTKDASDAYFSLEGKVGGLDVIVIANREDVCERVVVGTRDVVEEAPDPEAVAALPKTTVTRTEEIVEWRCSPVLGGA